MVVEIVEREVMDLEMRKKESYCKHNKGWVVE